MPTSHEAEAWPEADVLFRQDPRWLGADGAYSVEIEPGLFVWLFADSWVDPQGRGSRQLATFVRNTVGLQHGNDPSRARLELFWRLGEDRRPSAFFPAPESPTPNDPALDAPAFSDEWAWPGHGARVGRSLLIFLLRVRSTSSGLGFSAFGTRALRLRRPGPAPLAWDLEEVGAWANPFGALLGAGGLLVHDGFLYALAPEQEAPFRVYLARWALTSASRSHLGLPQWWTGQTTGWRRVTGRQDGSGLRPEPLFHGGQTELTVHWESRLRRFVIIQVDGFGATTVSARLSPHLTGSWSHLHEVYEPPERALPGILLYGAKAHPGLRAAGADLVLTYCSNTLSSDDIRQHPDLYYPRFIKVRVPERGLP